MKMMKKGWKAELRNATHTFLPGMNLVLGELMA